MKTPLFAMIIICMLLGAAHSQEVIKISPSDIFSGMPTSPTLTLTPTPIHSPTPSPSPTFTPKPTPTLKPSPTPMPTPTPSPSPTPAPKLSPVAAPIKTPAADAPTTPALTVSKPQPRKSNIIFDNAALNDFIRTNPLPDEKQISEKPIAPLPDIETLRRQLHAPDSMTPAPASGYVKYELPLRIQNIENPWAENVARLDVNYLFRAFLGSIEITRMRDGETIRFLKNIRSHEFLTLEPGVYQIRGEFWLLRNPSEKIKGLFGEYTFAAQTSYLIEMDSQLEQALLYELELREAEKLQEKQGRNTAPYARERMPRR
ncbi:MAG TPA: hypothetical protein PKW18_10850 [Candidatus Sumerlaeota bacterium]|nr:hypothetical protein [Candidatus Sumerlaeota bacterium]HON49851.1 hypothetical protein [Candidatus Sumerlaeota bacterium]HOR63901.1 hypothetical protein [Candidatus Sumerlaeota bacterium]HPL75049.1 hypothetical protein [Candidatus Sumerlaeota bacterium]HRU54523.1 hypothetical protein [Candidatus Sumerlaeia bacterium]